MCSAAAMSATARRRWKLFIRFSLRCGRCDAELFLGSFAFHECGPCRAIHGYFKFQAVAGGRQHFYGHLLLDILPRINRGTVPGPGIAGDRAGRGQSAALTVEGITRIEILVGVVTGE